MKQVQLGTSGLRISPLVYGTLPLGPLQADLSPAAAGRLIRHALERGVTMLDTAALYRNFPHLRAGLEGWRGEVVIATKTHAADAATARSQVETALRELGRERLEIVHLHAARLADPFRERAAVLEVLLTMKEEGKIAHVGVSSHYIAAIAAAARRPEIEIVHPLINRAGLGILDGSPAEMAQAIAACAAAGKGVYAMKALAGGNLISEARQSLAYAAGLEGVHGIAIGMLSEAEIEANISFLESRRADDAVWVPLENRRRRLRIMDQFCKGCGKCLSACGSGALSLLDARAVVDPLACVLCGYCGADCPEFIIRVV